MKILFVTPETPITGGGGIATYIKHAKDAFLSQGHQVFTFSWVHREDREIFLRAHGTDQDRIVALNGWDVWKQFPNGPYQVGLSYTLLPHIKAFVEEISPDVIETTDFLGPLYAYLAERRAGRLGGIARIPVIGFNHGLTRLLYSKNGVLPQPHVQPELAAERQSMRWCDLVFVPSQTALRSFEYQVGHRDNTFVVNEPYPWAVVGSRPFHPAPHLYHLGRVSFSKGIDHAIHFANVLTHIKPIESVTFIGKHDPLPFRTTDVKRYLQDRAARSLAQRLRFPGQLSHNDYAKVFSPGGYSLNFSSQETFNYAFLEMLGHGLFPFIKAQTPMEEFLPADLAHLTLPPDFDLRGLPELCRELDQFAEEYHGKIAAHVQDMTDPARYVARYEALLTARNPRAIISRADRGAPFNAKDITVLMATYNNAELIKESVASIRSQDVQPARTVIIDDGSYDPDALSTLQALSRLPGVEVVRSTQNEGLCATRVKLLDYADTPLSVFLDSDDLLTHDYLKKTLAAMNGSPILPDAVLTWRQNFGVSNELVVNDLLGDHYHQMRNDFRMTALMRTEVLKQIGFASSMRNGEADDWVFWLKFDRAGYRSVMVGEPLFLYRFADGSMSWPWSEGQAALTGVEIAGVLTDTAAPLSDQAIEDLVAERIWHILNHGSENGAPVAGETFASLYRWSVALRDSRPKLFAVLRGIGRPMARRIGRSRA